MQVTISNIQNGGQTADVAITYGPPSTSALAGYGNVSETYRQVSTYPYLSSGPSSPQHSAGDADQHTWGPGPEARIRTTFSIASMASPPWCKS